MKDYFTYTILIDDRSSIFKADTFWSAFPDAEYVQMTSDKFLQYDKCSDVAAKVVTDLVTRELRVDKMAVVIQVNPYYQTKKKKYNDSWSKNTLARIFGVRAQDISSGKVTVCGISANVDFSRELSNEEIDIYFK